MRSERDTTRIVRSWLEGGSTAVPDRVLDAVLAELPSTPQRRSTWSRWRFQRVTTVKRIAVGAAVIAVVVGVSVLGPRSGVPGVGSPVSPAPSASPSPPYVTPIPRPSASPIPVPPLTEAFDSAYAYSIAYPADWTATAAAEVWSPEEWLAAGAPEEPFDWIRSSSERYQDAALRAASGLLPEGASADDWIRQYVIGEAGGACDPPRETTEAIVIDGHPGRLRDLCGEIEATVVAERRVYVFTLFVRYSDPPVKTGARELFDALAATIQLRPDDPPALTPAPAASIDTST